MKQENLIINLIHEDLKHYQLVLGLELLGFNRGEFHYLALFEIILKLMNIPDSIHDRFSEVYVDCMNKAVDYEITHDGASLKPLAESCYGKLKALPDNEKLEH